MSEDFTVCQNSMVSVMRFKAPKVTSTAVYDDSVSFAYNLDSSSYFHRFFTTSLVTPLSITLPIIGPDAFSTSFYMAYYKGTSGSQINFIPNAANYINAGALGATFTVKNFGNTLLLFFFSYRDTWFIGSADQPVTITGGPGITVTGSYPNFTVSLAAAEYFTFTYDTIVAQNYLAGSVFNTLLNANLTATTVGGTDFILGVSPGSLEYVAARPKIYMVSTEIQQDSSTTNFRPQIYLTRENVTINGNGLSLGSGGVAAGQTTAINSLAAGNFVTFQPGENIYFSVNNNASTSLAGVSTNFKYILHFAEAR
jgi:hypothetical protein